jgi:hypothetical protein
MSLAACVEESVLSLALLCADWSVEDESRVVRSEEDDDEDDDDEDESLRRGAVSWLEDEALLLMAWVLLSTSDPKESLGVWSLVLCERAGFCCALETCALAATSDVTPTTGDPLKHLRYRGQQGAGQSFGWYFYPLKSMPW